MHFGNICRPNQSVNVFKSEFFAIFGCSAHLTLDCDEMAGNRLRQRQYEIFSTKRRFQQSRSWPL